ncbi:bifunctional metallophosphatase/5'-nucleotidase [Geothrix edaphica]|uniref:Multifunctional 2',3'-cyclic-nucleotide 2'-phosphodiesterase/5'-nucleotidase/3'-nucleotidase n=1 Tax=Geothrix edaphica TaxID=2927976 RepID=A0ABQ5PYU8_9BACT|nr:bifunctional UDP-sugar hydrolase/5'-nucleotidase [Geothrix edaphica]GLH67326.1 multifunctional 2',3'-cyclic-nucleotide 2'-phosphodiesterase/5'-nucleotidase/3'-nucleotidase [Geothrix edaphica]
MRHWLWILLIALGLQAQEARIQILGTTDLHGHVMAEETFSLQPANQGWAKLATLIRRQRALNPDTILVDCGDTIQGEPLNYVRNTLRRDLPEPSVAIMNALGYAAMAVGNHEYDFGQDLLREVEKQARFPFLSANTLTARGLHAFPTHTLVTVGGVRVAVVGFTTPRTAALAGPRNATDLVFQDIVAAARELVPRLREKEKADVVVALLHSGLGTVDGHAGDENAALRLADQVPGLDAIFTGHTHQAIQTEYKGIPILQAQVYGRALAVVDLSLRKEKGRWRVGAAQGRLLRPEADTLADPEVARLTAELRAATDRYLDTAATNLLVDLDSRWARMEDTPLMQLLHQVQRQATGAQLSAAASPGARLFIPKGPTSVRQFYALAPYENQVARIRITGAQLKAYLEHAARHYTYSWEPELYNREVPIHDFDTVDGVAYALNLGRPVGSRVASLSYQGQPVKPEQTFTLALTTYRLGGGGGYMEAIGFKGTPDLVTEASQRNLLLAYVLARPTLNPAVPNAWRTIPYLDRERVLNQAK